MEATGEEACRLFKTVFYQYGHDVPVAPQMLDCALKAEKKSFQTSLLRLIYFH
jgi:hypothetical protein